MVWALVDVAERDLGNIAVAQPVMIRARSFPGRTFSGTIAVIYPQVNRETRTARVRIELANPDSARRRGDRHGGFRAGVGDPRQLGARHREPPGRSRR